MYILDINQNRQKKHNMKMIAGYLFASVLSFVVNKIYAIFGHGVSSDAMTWMFLYPLAGGVLLYLLIELLIPQIKQFAGYRLFCNLYNTGIAVLTVGSFLKGIVEIAGTDSKYITLYHYAGEVFVGAGLLCLTLMVANYRKLRVKN